MNKYVAEHDAAYWRARYEALCRRIERMARESGRVRTPRELRALMDIPPGEDQS